MNGTSYGENDPLPLRSGERARLAVDNRSMMFHSTHLHGHTFAVNGAGPQGFRNDTVNVLPMCA